MDKPVQVVNDDAKSKYLGNGKEAIVPRAVGLDAFVLLDHPFAVVVTLSAAVVSLGIGLAQLLGLAIESHACSLKLVLHNFMWLFYLVRVMEVILAEPVEIINEDRLAVDFLPFHGQICPYLQEDNMEHNLNVSDFDFADYHFNE
jgi:hypothetical protein